MKHAARYGLLVLSLCAALFIAALATCRSAPAPELVRFSIESMLGYTYGPLDELRFDVTCVPTDDGPYEDVLETDFSRQGRYYEPVTSVESNGKTTVTYALRPLRPNARNASRPLARPTRTGSAPVGQ